MRKGKPILVIREDNAKTWTHQHVSLPLATREGVYIRIPLEIWDVLKDICRNHPYISHHGLMKRYIKEGLQREFPTRAARIF